MSPQPICTLVYKWVAGLAVGSATRPGPRVQSRALPRVARCSERMPAASFPPPSAARPSSGSIYGAGSTTNHSRRPSLMVGACEAVEVPCSLPYDRSSTAHPVASRSVRQESEWLHSTPLAGYGTIGYAVRSTGAHELGEQSALVAPGGGRSELFRCPESARTDWLAGRAAWRPPTEGSGPGCIHGGDVCGDTGMAPASVRSPGPSPPFRSAPPT